jgi:hypothetical protein
MSEPAMKGPNVSALRRSEHLDAGFVTKDEVALAHALEQACRQRREQLRVSVKEIGHRAARDGDTEPSILLLEPVEWQ